MHGDLERLAIDDVGQTDRIVYVSRGTHVVTGMVHGQSIRKTEQVEAGDVVSVVLQPPSPLAAQAIPTTEPPLPPAAPPRAAAAVTPERAGWPRWIFFGGLALTAIAAGLTVASGIDAIKAFDAHPTPANLSSGQSQGCTPRTSRSTSAGTRPISFTAT